MDSGNAPIQRSSNDTPEDMKRGYSKPNLSLYGNLKEITRAVGQNGAGDNSGMAMLKTG